MRKHDQKSQKKKKKKRPRIIYAKKDKNCNSKPYSALVYLVEDI